MSKIPKVSKVNVSLYRKIPPNSDCFNKKIVDKATQAIKGKYLRGSKVYWSLSMYNFMCIKVTNPVKDLCHLSSQKQYVQLLVFETADTILIPLSHVVEENPTNHEVPPCSVCWPACSFHTDLMMMDKNKSELLT